MVTSAYIHIPFCKSKCKYCSFISFTNLEDIEKYVESLKEEIKLNYKGEPLETLYFGGGTPSLLPSHYVTKIINNFNIAPNCEITFEINPDDANYTYLKELFDIGINRISMGSQSFNNEILKNIGRRHSAEDVKKAVTNAQNIGFKNVSLDLIYGLPNQTLEILQQDLDIISSLNIQHLSTYGLKIEENSYFGKNCPPNLPDDDLQADMYILINNFMKNKNFIRYEISNFAIKGFESKHNLNYWNNAEYYGFGLGAHGYLNGIRYANFNNFKDYIENSKKFKTEQILSLSEKLEEEIFLGFRKSEGIDINQINSKYNINFEKKYQEILKKYTPNFIQKTENGYMLTLEGTLLSNNILADFIESA